MSIFMSMIGSSDSMWHMALQSWRYAFLRKHKSTLLHMGWNERQWFISLKCEIFNDWLLRKWVGRYVTLHIDDWVFGFNLTYGPAILLICDPSGTQINIIAYGLKWDWVDNHFIRERDIWWFVFSEANKIICQSSCRWLDLRMQFETCPAILVGIPSGILNMACIGLKWYSQRYFVWDPDIFVVNSFGNRPQNIWFFCT
jgi:hypothetical protein